MLCSSGWRFHHDTGDVHDMNHQLFSVIPVNSPCAVKYRWSAQILIRLVLETIMRLSLISALVIAFSAASLVSAAPTGLSASGPSTDSLGATNNLPQGVCIVYAIYANG